MFWTKKRHFKVFSMILVCAILMQLSTGLFAYAAPMIVYDSGSISDNSVADSGDITLEDDESVADSGAMPMLRAAAAVSETPMPAGFITSIEMLEKMNTATGVGTEFAADKEFKKDEIFYLKYEYKIPTLDSGAAMVKDVPYFFSIPKEMDTSNNDLPFFDIKYNGKVAATAKVTNDKKVIITFNEYAEESKLLLPGTKGYFWFLMRFDKNEVENSGKQTVIFTKPANEGTIEKEINFAIDKVEAKVTMEKEATLNLAALDATSIDWIVKATADIIDPKNPNVTPAVPATITDLIITDKIEAPLVYNSTKGVTVRKHTSISDTSGTIITPNGVTYDDTAKTITITIPTGNSLKHGEYYTIKYNTTFNFGTVFSSSITEKTFTNTAKTTGFTHTQYVKGAGGKTETKQGEPATGEMPSAKKDVKLVADFVTKEGNLTGGKIDWKIKISPEAFAFTGGTITDTIPEGLTLDKSTVKWDKVEVIKSTTTPPAAKSGEYSITTKATAKSESTLTYAMSVIPTGETRTLSYTTTVDSGYAGLDKEFINKVKFEPENGPVGGFDKTASVHYGASVFSKEAGVYIPSTHTIPWKITMGEAGRTELLNPTVTEVLPEGLTLVGGSIKVDNKLIAVNETITLDSGPTVTLTKGKKVLADALIFKFNGTVKGMHEITFNTTVIDEKYWAANDKKNDEIEALKNMAYLAADGMSEHGIDAKPKVPSQILVKAKGENYDYIDKQASWVLTINQNQMAMVSPTITDTLDTTGLSFVEGSVEVTLKKGNTSTVITPKALTFTTVGEKPTMKLVLPDVEISEGEYIVKYKTAVADNILQQATPKIENTAVLSSETFPKTPATVTVPQNIAKPLVTKTGKDEKGKFYITWIVMINQNGATIKKPIVKDVLDARLTLDPSSIKLEELILKVNGDIEGAQDVTDSDTATFALEEESGKKVFTASFANDITTPYRLTFNTYYEEAATFANSVELVADGESISNAASGNVAGASATGGGGTSPKFGKIVITKTTEDTPAVTLKGAAFKLGQIKKTTDASGKIVFDGVRLGQKYTLTEVEAPYGFERLIVPIEITVDKFDANDEYIKTVTNKRITNGLTVTKTDGENDAPLNGAEFTVKRTNDGTNDGTNDNISFTDVVITSGKTATLKTVAGSGANAGKFVTSVDSTSEGTLGKAVLTGLPVGSYTVTETKAPSSYVLNASDDYSFSVEKNGEIQTHTFKNSRILGSLELTKTDDTTAAKPLAGAEFSVKSDSTAYQKTIITDATGKATLTGLPVGNYTVTETKAPSGYLLNATPKTFTIADNGEQQETQIQLKFTNTKIEGNLIVTKTDAADPTKTLQGAIYTATKTDTPNKGTQWSATTATNGVASFKLPVGTYSIAETTAPKGYVLNSTPQTVTITSDGKTQAAPQQLSFTNVKILGSLELTKTDDSTAAKPLEGAEFELYSTVGDVLIAKGITDEDGKLSFAELPMGEYYYKEKKAPTGYVKDEAKRAFSITTHEQVVAETFKNKAVPPSSSGGGGNTPSVSPPPEVIIVPPQTVPPTQVPGITPPTPSNTPQISTGNIDITPTGTPEVKVPPTNGTVTIDKNGKWVYTPNAGFVGEDEFTVTATYPSGYTETFIIKLSVLSGFAQFLPETGEAPRTMFYVGGLLFVALGVIIKRKLKKI